LKITDCIGAGLKLAVGIGINTALQTLAQIAMPDDIFFVRKYCVKFSMVCLSGVVMEKCGEYIDEKIDNFVTGFKNDIEEKETEDERATEEHTA